MKLSLVFKNILLQTVDRLCPSKRTGRPKTLGDEEALDCIFKVLRTGMHYEQRPGTFLAFVLLAFGHLMSERFCRNG